LQIARQKTSTLRLRNQHSVLLRQDFNTQLRGELSAKPEAFLQGGPGAKKSHVGGSIQTLATPQQLLRQ
jgi:hypothetical protein